MKKMIFVAVLFIIGVSIIVFSEPSMEILLTGMFLIAISIITSAFMIHFPTEKPKKRPVKRKK